MREIDTSMNGNPRLGTGAGCHPRGRGGPGPQAAVDAERQRLEAELEAARRRVDELARAYQEVNKDREEFKQRLTRERERMIDVERGNVAGRSWRPSTSWTGLSMSAQDGTRRWPRACGSSATGCSRRCRQWASSGSAGGPAV